MNQYFKDAGIGGAEKRTINIMETGARLTKVTEEKDKNDTIKG